MAWHGMAFNGGICDGTFVDRVEHEFPLCGREICGFCVVMIEDGDDCNVVQ